MATPTYTKSGTAAASPAKLDKFIFNSEVKSHELVRKAYLSYLANGRTNLAVVKKRGQVSGGGKKPWRQKGTGRARFGSSRNPIWRGGGIAFGPTGNENYTIKLSTVSKRQAVRDALSLSSEKISVIENFECKDGLVKPTLALLKKIDATGNVLLVVAKKDLLVERATRNVTNLKVVSAKYLNVFDILNADNIVISRDSLEVIGEWLGAKSE